MRRDLVVAHDGALHHPDGALLARGGVGRAAVVADGDVHARLLHGQAGAARGLARPLLRAVPRVLQRQPARPNNSTCVSTYDLLMDTVIGVEESSNLDFAGVRSTNK